MIVLKPAAMVAAVTAILAMTSGCSIIVPPSDGVQVKVVTNKLTDKQVKRLKMKLKRVDYSVTKIRHLTAGGLAMFNLSPVSDPKAFARKLDLYGRVTTNGNVITLVPKPGWP